MKVLLIVPSYNEEDNVLSNYKKIIDAIRKKGFEVDQIKFWIN